MKGTSLSVKIVKEVGFVICTGSTGAICHRLHRPWCQNLKPKHKGHLSHARYFRRLSDIALARGHTIADKDWICCPACFSQDERNYYDSLPQPLPRKTESDLYNED